MIINCKQDLYNYVDLIRDVLNITEHPVDIQKEAQKIEDLYLTYRSFKDPHIRGMLVPLPTDSECYSMQLRSDRSYLQNEFPCAHELIHFFRHRKEITVHMMYSDGGVRLLENSFYDWEADEGAAELLISYKVFIPECIKLIHEIERDHSFTKFSNFYEILSDRLHSHPAIIQNRANSLIYETYQCLKGVDLEDITILSKNQQNKRGIIMPRSIYGLINI